MKNNPGSRENRGDFGPVERANPLSLLRRRGKGKVSTEDARMEI